MTLASLMPLVPYAALVVAVNLGGLVAKAIWTALARSTLPGLGPLGRAMLATMRVHPAVVGAIIGALPWLLPGGIAQRVAAGLVLGEFAETLYTDGRAALRRMLGARASRPPEAGWTSVEVLQVLLLVMAFLGVVALAHVLVTRGLLP